MVLRAIYGGVLSLSVLVSAVVGLAALVRRQEVASLSLAGLFASAAIWSGSLLGELLATTPDMMLFFHRLMHVGVGGTVAALLVFALQYAGRRDLVTKRTVPLLAIEPIVVVSLSAAYPETTLLWTDGAVNMAGMMEMTYGPVYWLHILYTYAIGLVGIYLIVGRVSKASNVSQPAAFSLSFALVAPVLTGLVDAANLLAVSLTPVAFVLTAVGLYAGITEFELLDRAPVVRDIVVDAIDDPIVVVDGEEIVDANEAFEELFGVENAVGRRLGDVLRRHQTLLAHIREGTEATVETETRRGPRSLEVKLSPVDNEGGTHVGRLALLHDVTERQRQRQELERQNEQLDQFASLISHDLRNPLDVAMGRATVLRERVDDPDISEHLGEICEAHDRMRQIISDVLTLARQGQSIDEREPIDIADLAADAWSHVETDDATLEVTAEMTVGADRDRLAQVFENLFRNAVQHGGPGVTVTVGELDDGFFVADDGEGIPPAKRTQVLEAGYTDHQSGTGLGLSIVDNIVEAHGWDLRVATSESGGAQFEIVGVSRVGTEATL